LAPLSPPERDRFTALAARVKEQLQSMAGADAGETANADNHRPRSAAAS
jgi:hypothetical protein